MSKILKRVCSLLFCLVLCSACGSETDSKEKVETGTTDKVPVVINQAEYVLYQNVFFNGYGDSNTGEVTKKGVYAKIYDAFHGVTRHYVWGNLDQTLCCDWQWEFIPAEGASLPAEGSQITVKGYFVKDEEALDGYRILDAQVETEIVYTGKLEEINMETMSDTLERVQVQNILYRKEQFEGKRFTAYGRVAGTNMLQDPYYDGSWTIPYTSNQDQSAIGTMIHLRGVIQDATLIAE